MTDAGTPQAAETPVAHAREVWSALRFVDVLDVIVVAILVYTALTWLRRARSKFVFLGVLAAFGLYGLSRLLEMYLTQLVFQVGLTVALVALVVVFQEEIRRAFERLGSGGAFRSAPSAIAPEGTDMIVEAVAEMAKRRTGALIVLRGTEPLERHLTGGIAIDAKLSEPLLYSIFDHHSPGHDGAVVLEHGMIRTFATHLPLSTRLDGSEKFGTRHTAAIGLSERSDALVIVVSEERGEISVAEGGELEQVSPVELQRRLETFVERVAPPETSQALLQRLFARHWTLKAASLAIALVAWLVVFDTSTETMARTVPVPVILRDLPEGWDVEGPEPLEAIATLEGKARSFQRLDETKLALTPDLADLKRGAQRLALEGKDLDLPSGVNVTRIDPSHVKVVAYETTTVRATVRPKTRGSVAPGHWVAGIDVEPKTVQLVVRKPNAARARTVATEPVDVTGIEGERSVEARLDLPEGADLADDATETVTVTVRIAAKGQAP